MSKLKSRNRWSRGLTLQSLEAREVPALFLVMGAGDESGLAPNGGNGTLASPFLIGSLRSAVERANLTPTVPDTIWFNGELFDQTIVLDIDHSPITFGRGARTTVDGLDRQIKVDGNGFERSQRVFDVLPGASVAIRNLTVQNGIDGLPSSFDPPPLLGGGGIYNAGALVLSDVVVTGNRSFNVDAGGGGIYNAPGGRVSLFRSTISNNQVDLDGSAVWGGGIFNSGIMTIRETTIDNNRSLGNGGGIYNAGILIVKDSTISNNQSNFSDGFGEGSGSGGGIANNGYLRMTNATVSNNITGGTGGGIYNDVDGTTFLTNCTVTENLAFFGGGGAHVRKLDPGNAFVMRSTIVSGNYNSDEVADDLLGDFESPRTISDGVPVFASYCLIGTSFLVKIIGVGNQLNVTDPMLGPLQPNGGSTQTHAVLDGSPAINRGDPNSAGLPLADQRGLPYWRVRGGRVDIGAIEVQVGSFPRIANIFRFRDRRYH